MHDFQTPDACAAPVPKGFRADLPRWRQLVSADWLAALLAQRAASARPAVAAAPAPDWLLLEVACDGLEAWLSGHIPGAQYLDTRELEHLPFWNKLPQAELVAVLQHHGIAPGTTVILYGRNTLAAARAAHCLLVAGVHDVRLLDGGLAAWCEGGRALQRGQRVVAPPAAMASPADFVERADYLVHTPEVRAMVGQPEHALVSIRTRAEFLGLTSGYSYIQPRGEIAGALWGHAGLDGDVNSMRNFQDAQGRMKPAAEIARLWAEAGIHPHMRIAFYCGTGWRASLAFFYAWLMGWQNICVYDGGWFEWSADPANPIQGAGPELRRGSRRPVECGATAAALACPHGAG